ncbi:MAG: pseudouridine-5'-phosphate glycosidase [Gammaproteobacteria bacterium]|nr:pseudouridine-5'-phosphate glycosidase [Gammaproteobacteria bacterium]
MTEPVVHPRIREALESGAAVVALETSVVAHGLPWPHNLDTARAMAAAVAAAGAVPAFVGVRRGRAQVGLDEAELEHFARNGNIPKASRRDLPALVARGADGATTVAATMSLAAAAGIEVFATGGIGGVHRGATRTFDVSADIVELARTPVAVVCSGAKSILDIPATLELLETHGVPVIGYATDRFPAFYVRETAHALTARAGDAESAAHIICANRTLGAGGLVVANPIPGQAAIDAERVEEWIEHALDDARRAAVSGRDLTPFLLARVAAISEGRTLTANRALLECNAGVAGHIAVALRSTAASLG